MEEELLLAFGTVGSIPLDSLDVGVDICKASWGWIPRGATLGAAPFSEVDEAPGMLLLLLLLSNGT